MPIYSQTDPKDGKVCCNRGAFSRKQTVESKGFGGQNWDFTCQVLQNDNSNIENAEIE